MQTSHAVITQVPQQLLSIPTKICDGLFMADQLIAQDLEWIEMNQVTHIINCAGKHTKNNIKIPGISFLTFQWGENLIQNILDQNVIGTSLNFIEQAKKIGGSVLVHCCQSQSRPFCILAAYLMIRYQWNLFKTLEFLNSRKEDIQLQPAFFQQLTTLHQKLQEKGLIRSRNWQILDGMTDEEIILTNTFLNSRKRLQTQNKGSQHAQQNKRRQKNKKTVNWKNQLHVFHLYSPHTILAELVPKRNCKSVENTRNNMGSSFLRNSREKLRAESNSSKNHNQSVDKEKQNDNIVKRIIQKKSNQQKNQVDSNITKQADSSVTKQGDSNVTKKWAQLRQTWSKQKENNFSMTNKQTCTFLLQSEITRKQQPQENSRNHKQPQIHQNSNNNNNGQTTAILLKKQQKIGDKIQQKLNMLKSGYQREKQKFDLQRQRQISKRRDHTPITGKKVSKNHQEPKMQKKQRESLINRQNRNKDEDKENKIMQNNSAINNSNGSNVSSIKEKERQFQNVSANNLSSNSANNASYFNNNASGFNPNLNGNFSHIAKTVKQMGNKSVLIVKPNQYNQQNRMSLKKMNANNNPQPSPYNNEPRNSQKPQRQTSKPKFFKTTDNIPQQTSATQYVGQKARSNSAKPQRKESMNLTSGMSNMSMIKNSSFSGKGKWKC